jgi:hypothetical protein
MGRGRSCSIRNMRLSDDLRAELSDSIVDWDQPTRAKSVRRLASAASAALRVADLRPQARLTKGQRDLLEATRDLLGNGTRIGNALRDLLATIDEPDSSPAQ